MATPKSYRIMCKFYDPYISQRNGGDREWDSHLSLKCAQERLLQMFNERFDEGYAKNWGRAVIASENKGYIKAFATDNYGMRSFDFDGRTFYIEEMPKYISIDRKRLEKAKELFTRRKKYIKKYLKK